MGTQVFPAFPKDYLDMYLANDQHREENISDFSYNFPALRLWTRGEAVAGWGPNDIHAQCSRAQKWKALHKAKGCRFFKRSEYNHCCKRYYAHLRLTILKSYTLIIQLWASPEKPSATCSSMGSLNKFPAVPSVGSQRELSPKRKLLRIGSDGWSDQKGAGTKDM